MKNRWVPGRHKRSLYIQRKSEMENLLFQSTSDVWASKDNLLIYFLDFTLKIFVYFKFKEKKIITIAYIANKRSHKLLAWKTKCESNTAENYKTIHKKNASDLYLCWIYNYVYCFSGYFCVFVWWKVFFFFIWLLFFPSSFFWE